MKRSKYFMIAAAIVVVSTFVLAACSSPVGPPANANGSLQIMVANNINTRTIVPAIDMTAATYTVTGTGPNSATFTATTTGSPVTETGLAVGSWTVVVNASNSTPTLIGTGSATATVSIGATTPVAVNVTPISGTGSLALTVDWPTTVTSPSITATLTPAPSGTPQDLTFSVSGATATYSNSAVANGYYTLTLNLLNNGVVVAGATDVVRIVTGQPTSGTISISNVNSGTGGMTVTITTNLQNPLLASISGAQATLSTGNTMALTASVSNYSSTVNYAWYVNGANQSTSGPTFTFGSGAAVGYYRIDVTAYSADGTQGGSATANVQVTTATTVPSVVNLASAGNYAILAQSAISTTGTTAITGDIAVSPAAATYITGFGLILDSTGTFSTSSLVTGNVYAADYTSPTPATLITAVSDMQAAYTAAAALPSSGASFLNIGAGTVGGLTLAPGVYTWGTAVGITSDITLSGSATDTWVFQVGGALSVSTGVKVILSGGALPQNIFWQVAGATTIGTTAQMNGNILDATAITMGAGASISGRLLAQTAVALDANAVTQ